MATTNSQSRLTRPFAVRLSSGLEPLNNGETEVKIRKLELHGFKSFVDRTVVRFDSDVLGIVGPNGCGKSNIVDAIRWCMGEQSAKHLRGRSMEDVLFSGSESRAGVDFAEVTLTFDNDDPTDVPIEFKEYAEIAVTRRLHRNGDSEYLVNKTPVRLKDITDLFLGTGAGTKAYSIVEQGRIGLIVSAKPEDRRMLIEEAAGITKYKSRKKQAEKKMELTLQNLLRVGDIVAEIERNLGSLKRQAAKAERFLAYRNELEDLQLFDASHRYLELIGWTKLYTVDVAHLGEKNEQLRTDLGTREAEIETARFSALAAEDVLEKAQNESFACTNAVRTEEAAIDRARDRLASLREREDQSMGEQKSLHDQHVSLESERDVLAYEVASFEADETVRAEDLAAREASLAESVSAHHATEERVVSLARAVSQAHAEIASSQAKLEGFERRREDAEMRANRLEGERERLEGDEVEYAARSRALEKELEDVASGKVLTDEEKIRLEERLATLRQDIMESERQLDEAKTELGKKRSRYGALEEVQSRLEGVGAGAKALMATKDPTIVGLVGDRIQAPKELTAALAGLLGQRLEEIVVEDDSRGLDLLEDLATSKKGRATIVPRFPRHVAGTGQSLPPCEGVIGRLFDRLEFAAEDEALVRWLVGDAVVVTDVIAATNAREHARSTPIVTLAGTVFFGDGRIAGGSGEEVAAGRLDAMREMRELEVEVRRLDAVASERLARHQALRGAIAEAQTGLEHARQECHKGELLLVTCEKDLRATMSKLEGVQARLAVVTRESEEIRAAQLIASAERQSAEELLEIATDAKTQAEGEVVGAQAERDACAALVQTHRDATTESKVRLAGARERLMSAKGTLLRLDKSIAELTERAARIERELEEGARAFGETAATLVLHKETLVAALDAARDAEDALTASRRVYDDLRTALAAREVAVKDLRARADETREALSEAEMRLREKQLDLAHLLDAVREKFRGLQLLRVVGDYHLRPPPDDESRSRITELIQLVDRMGSVNLDAMREHDEAEKRYAFYTEQKADLEKAISDLDKAIAQMNKESKRLFAVTFAAVNAKFEEIFPRMFRGGRASLKLTNPDDMLETGIDILAQPPGKKLSSIELMSGGEKALTAVSLIFAIFQVKPSPFCILDEVDAPLDEANVSRYNDMVRSMTASSQFILITHIKRTMQMVDVLYGVTMQESGVSRVVSVRLNEAAEATRPEPKKASESAPDAAAVA